MHIQPSRDSFESLQNNLDFNGESHDFDATQKALFGQVLDYVALPTYKRYDQVVTTANEMADSFVELTTTYMQSSKNEPRGAIALLSGLATVEDSKRTVFFASLLQKEEAIPQNEQIFQGHVRDFTELYDHYVREHDSTSEEALDDITVQMCQTFADNYETSLDVVHAELMKKPIGKLCLAAHTIQERGPEVAREITVDVAKIAAGAAIGSWLARKF